MGFGKPILLAAKGRASEGIEKDQEGMGFLECLKHGVQWNTAFQRDQTFEADEFGFGRVPTAREERDLETDTISLEGTESPGGRKLTNVAGVKQTRRVREVACGPVRRERRNANGGF